MVFMWSWFVVDVITSKYEDGSCFEVLYEEEYNERGNKTKRKDNSSEYKLNGKEINS